MKMRIEFSMDNDSLVGADDLQRAAELHAIMEDIVDDLNKGHEDGGIRDCNGNTIGKWTITEKD